LSPFLFAVYVDDLIEQLSGSGFGIYIGCLFCGCILQAYADDIVAYIVRLIDSGWSYFIVKLNMVESYFDTKYTH